MRHIAIFASIAMSLAACADATTPSPADGSSASPPTTVDERRVGVYGALIPELVGSEGMQWRHIYVVTNLCGNPADPVAHGTGDCGDVLTETEQQALRERLDLENLRFIDDPEPLYDDGWFQGPPNEVVVTLGPIIERAGGVRVGASYGCGGLCGAGNTWVLEELDEEWSVVGSRGPGWIA